MTELPTPPRPLQEHGLAFWNRIIGEFEITNPGDLEQILLASETVDTLTSIAVRLAEDGLTLDNGKGNPLLRDQLGGRAFVARVVQRIQANSKPKRRVGRPGGDIYWAGPHAA